MYESVLLLHARDEYTRTYLVRNICLFVLLLVLFVVGADERGGQQGAINDSNKIKKQGKGPRVT